MTNATNVDEVLFILETIIKAKSPSDIFSKKSKDEYKKLAKLCHPDKVHPALKERAEKAFDNLNKLFQLINIKADTKIGPWGVINNLSVDAVCSSFLVTKDGSSVRNLRVSHSPKYNKFMKTEAKTLMKLGGAEPKNFRAYVPSYEESFLVDGRQVNITSATMDGYSLEYIKNRLLGIPFIHIVWMMNRLLSVLGFAHENGIIHGAVLPCNLIYKPADHGLTLIDWTASVKNHSPIKLVRKSFIDNYPKEVELKKELRSTADIYMATKAMKSAASSIPKRFRGFFEWCLAESPNSRPSEAWKVQDRWMEIARQEYGSPKFVPLEIGDM